MEAFRKSFPRFWAILKNFTLKEVVSDPDRIFSIRPQPIVAIKEEYDGYTSSHFPNGGFSIHSNYIFLNKDFEEVIYSINGWTIETLKQEKIWDKPIKYTICDPMGEQRSFKEFTKNHLETICEILKIINEYSDYHSWADYDLKIENRTLRLEIIQLKNEIKKLLKENKTYKRELKSIKIK
jgi:hypothetical protein